MDVELSRLRIEIVKCGCEVSSYTSDYSLRIGRVATIGLLPSTGESLDRFFLLVVMLDFDDL